jgi:(p)ppGpp synthase/HD superfamily hydrolase
MTPDKLHARFKELTTQMVDICEKKNKDYANQADALANFRRCERLGVTMLKGMLVRMSDKMERMGNLLDRPPAVEDEAIEDTAMDTAIYSLLFLIALEDKKRNP